MARLIVLAALLLALAPAAARADFSFDRTDFDTATNAQLYDVAIADLGGANGPDIVATAFNRNKLVLLRNQGSGTFAAPVERDACGNGNAFPAQIVAGQFNAGTDQVGDVAVACGFVAIVPGGGADGLNAPQATAWQTRGIIAAGELNGGGNTELVFGGPAGGNKAVLCFLIQPFSSANAICGNDPMEPQPPLLPDALQGFWAGTPAPVVADLVGPASPRHDEVFGLNTTHLDAITIYNRAPISRPRPVVPVLERRRAHDEHEPAVLHRRRRHRGRRRHGHPRRPQGRRALRPVRQRDGRHPAGRPADPDEHARLREPGRPARRLRR